MGNLVDSKGNIQFGLYEHAILDVNYRDYALQTPMGIPIPGFLKKLKFNQFHFFGILGPEVLVGLAVVDLKMMTNGFFYLYDRATLHLMETKKLSLPGKDIHIATCPDDPQSRFAFGGLDIRMDKHKVVAQGKGFSLEVEIALEKAHPLRLCSRAGYRGWVYTQKTSPIELSGRVRYAGKTLPISSPEYMGLMDWTGGFMRKYTFWNWASTACTLPDGRAFGLNLSCGVNETSFTENAFWLAGDRTKISTVNFIFNAKDLYSPWRIVSADDKVDLVFHPECERGEKLHAGILASRFTQLMGTLDGTVTTDAGEKVRLDACPAWAEDHYAKW